MVEIRLLSKLATASQRQGASERKTRVYTPVHEGVSTEATQLLTAEVEFGKKSISVAPMLDWTDRHCRFFLRLLSKHLLLYTEMITVGAIIHGDRHRHLAFNPSEHPVALQLGGSDPIQLAECALIGEDYGYDEINLNVGCPSDRVQSGRFGACLMAEPDLVAECIAAMKAKVSIPVTVKSRIGIDHQDSYDELAYFVRQIEKAGCDQLIVHARKAWLHGLSPKENREIPPLNYPWVYQLKRDFPGLPIVLNGGVTDLDQAAEHLKFVDGVMIGRAAYHNSYMLAAVDQYFFNGTLAIRSREDIIADLIPYVQEQARLGVAVKHITRHLLGLFQGVAGGKRWRRFLSDHSHLVDADYTVLLGALAYTQHT
ncbi:MAG: tRNA dihydrouridine(20/20a) synthase DusA [Legionellales bacterium]|nr:tRNA dihydrouridine(20/20a) synthase DusA [Legionellales bacterium]